MPLVGEEVMKEEKFPCTRKPSHRRGQEGAMEPQSASSSEWELERKTQRKFNTKITATNQ